VFAFCVLLRLLRPSDLKTPDFRRKEHTEFPEKYHPQKNSLILMTTLRTLDRSMPKRQRTTEFEQDWKEGAETPKKWGHAGFSVGNFAVFFPSLFVECTYK
jgi:hypothetical protein